MKDTTCQNIVLTIIAIVSITLFLPIAPMKTKELMKEAIEFKRKSKDLERIDEITALEKKIMKQLEVYDDMCLEDTDSIRREIDRELNETGRCLPIFSSIVQLARAIVNVIMISR